MERPPGWRLPAYPRCGSGVQGFLSGPAAGALCLHRARTAATVRCVGIAEVLVVLGIGALLFFALTPFRRWVERRYVRHQVRARGGGVVIPMRKRADGSYGPL